MTDEAGAAGAAPEPVAQPQAGGSQSAAEPARVGTERSKEPARASIDRAFAEIDKREKDEAAPKAKEAKEPKETKESKESKEQPASEGRERDEQGRFKSKDTITVEDVVWTAESGKPEKTEKPAESAADKPKPIADAPARFSPDAKAAWATTPDPIKSEIVRTFRELEGGLREYQQVLEPLKSHIALAKQHGTTIHQALDNYLGVERALRGQDVQQKLTAIEGIFETAGISPRDYAAHIAGQKPDQVQSQNDQTIRQLRQELADLRSQIGGVSQSIQERSHNDVVTQVSEFAKANPRMQEQDFAEVVAELITSGYKKTLPEAYETALLLKPAPIVDAPKTAAPAATEAAHTRTPNAAAQTRSIGGAPASGSNPTMRKPPSTAREALDRAFASTGFT